LVRVEAAVSGGEALRDDPNNGCGGDYVGVHSDRFQRKGLGVGPKKESK